MTSYHCAQGCETCRPSPEDIAVTEIVGRVHKLQTTPSHPDDYQGEIDRLLAEFSPAVVMSALMEIVGGMCERCLAEARITGAMP